MSTVTATDFCTRIKRLIALEKAEIKRTERGISIATAELERLEAASPPDIERIKIVKQHLADLEEHLADTRDGLSQAEEDRFQFCSPDQPEL
jgi:chromosome segregation ATPase